MSFKNNFKVLIFISTFLFLASNVFGAYPTEVSSYTRSPAGYLAKNPVSFSVELSEYPTPLCNTFDYWNIMVDGLDELFLPNIASTTLTLAREKTFPIDEYLMVKMWCFETSTSTLTEGSKQAVGEIEYDDGNTIFKVVENYYLNIGTGFATGTLTYAEDLFTDLELVIIFAVGLPVGFWIIKKIISLLRVR